MLGPDVIDNCWRKNLTINMEGVFELAGLLEPIIWPKWNSPNYTTETTLAITLYYLKDPGSLWMTASTFGAHQSTVSKTASKVWKAINEILSPKFLHLPGTIEEMREQYQNLKWDLEHHKHLVALMEQMFLWRDHKIFLITGSVFHKMFRQFVTAKVGSLMLHVIGQD